MAQIRKVDPAEVEVEPSPRQRLVALLREEREANPDLSNSELADDIAATLPDEDRALVEAYLASEARNILALELNRVTVSNRRQIMQVFDLKNPKAPPVMQRSEKVRNTLYERIERWREYVPSQHQTRDLLDMTRDELRESAQYDFQRTFTHAFKARLKNQLADGMNATQVVSDVYTTERIVDITQRVKNEMTRGNFRLKITRDMEKGLSDGNLR